MRGGCLALAAVLLLGCGGGASLERFTRPAPIPPLVDLVPGPDGIARVELVAQGGQTEFIPGRPAETYGYNGAFLGPTLRVQRGQRVEVTLRNALPPSDHDHTNLHWHGLKAAGDVDIFPSGGHGLHPGKSARAAFTPDQPAATLWYHPHPHGHTGPQVMKGLAGLLYLEDGRAEALDLPRTYGVDDLPLVVQDRWIRPDGSLAGMDAMGGRDFTMGPSILVNGVVSPYLEIPAGLVRFRLLNGSSTRRYLFALEDRRTFHQIASDGGFLEAPVPRNSLPLGPGERAEILVDFHGDLGRVMFVRSEAFGAAEEERAVGQGLPFPVLQLRVARAGSVRPLPTALVEVPRIPITEASRTRAFHLEDTGDGVINGQRFDPDRLDARIPEGATEIWEITNHTSEIAHPFHVHGGQFQLLDRDGLPPEPGEAGWKDTFQVGPRERVRVVLRFRGLSGRYMFHCHILEHEDAGMMGQYEVLP